MTKQAFFDTARGRIVLIFTALVLITAGVLIPLYAVGILGNQPSKVSRSGSTEEEVVYKKYTIDSSSLPKGKYAKFTFTYNGNDTSLQFYLLSEYAPKTVDTFVRYAEAGAYDGTVLWNADVDYYENTSVRSAYVQAGTYVFEEGALVKREPKENYGKVEGEFVENGYTGNTVSHTAGILTMIHPENDKNGADTDIMFLPKDFTELNGKYAAFGIIVDSDGCEQLLTYAQAVSSSSVYPVTIKSVSIYEKSK